MEGKVVRKVAEKGFGFIQTKDEAKDIFFHMTSLKNIDFDSLSEGQQVQFDRVDSPKGPRAENVFVY